MFRGVIYGTEGQTAAVVFIAQTSNKGSSIRPKSAPSSFVPQFRPRSASAQRSRLELGTVLGQRHRPTSAAPTKPSSPKPRSRAAPTDASLPPDVRHALLVDIIRRDVLASSPSLRPKSPPRPPSAAQHRTERQTSAHTDTTSVLSDFTVAAETQGASQHRRPQSHVSARTSGSPSIALDIEEDESPDEDLYLEWAVMERALLRIEDRFHQTVFLFKRGAQSAVIHKQQISEVCSSFFLFMFVAAVLFYVF